MPEWLGVLVLLSPKNRKIELTQGYFALVDAEDFELVSKFSWHASVQRGKVYADGITGKRPNRKRIRMHRMIMQCPPDMLVDHIDGNSLNNQKSNLRLCNNTENVRNQAGHRDRAGKFKGVIFQKERNKYCAKLSFNGKLVYSKRYSNEVDAAKAYDMLARKYFGEFARTNFTEE